MGEKMVVWRCAVEKLLRELPCVSLLICGRGWEKCEEVLGVAFVFLVFLQVSVVVGVVCVVERGGGGGLTKAGGGEGARPTSRRSRSARHRWYERLEGAGEERDVYVVGTGGTGGTGQREVERTLGAAGEDRGGEGERLVRWEDWDVYC